MEREFVSYTEALALKELGFDEPCFGYYDATSLEKYEFIFQKNVKNSDFIFGMTAPLYQQAFRWFRKKGQDSTILPTSQFYTPLVYNEIPSGKKKELYITYEDAELECLKKLIQFVKEK
jgi:hypothetical protein